MMMDGDIGRARIVFLSSNVRSAVSRTICGAAGDICDLFLDFLKIFVLTIECECRGSSGTPAKVYVRLSLEIELLG
jgi:hypothetical protein